MSKEIQDATDQLNELLSEMSYEYDVQFVDLDAWSTGTIVRVIELLDSELQRRYDEGRAENEKNSGNVTVH